MNGQEMMMQALFKTLGIDPKAIAAQGQGFINMANAFKEQLDRIEAKQDRILTLLGERDNTLIIVPIQTETRIEK